MSQSIAEVIAEADLAQRDQAFDRMRERAIRAETKLLELRREIELLEARCMVPDRKAGLREVLALFPRRP